MKTKILLLVLLMIVGYNFSFGESSFILGAKEETETLTHPRLMKEGPDGNIYVYDVKDAFIKVYSPDGSLVRKIGGKGEGPGLIKRTDGITFGFTEKKKLYFTEYFGGHRWITVLNLDGTLDKVINLKIDAKMYGVEKSAPLPDGGFLLDLTYWGEKKKEKDFFAQSTPHELCRVDHEGNVISTIKKADYFDRISLLGRGGDIAIPYFPVFAWCDFKNNAIIFSDGLSKDLSILNHNGQLTGKIKTSLPEPEKVTSKDLDKWRDGIKERYTVTSRGKRWYLQYGKVVEKYKDSLYNVKPSISGISRTPKGNIVIAGPWKESKERVYWLLTEKGELISKKNLNVFDVKITGNFLLLYKFYEDGSEYIHCFKRKGDETRDFVGLKRLPDEIEE